MNLTSKTYNNNDRNELNDCLSTQRLLGQMGIDYESVCDNGRTLTVFAYCRDKTELKFTLNHGYELVI